MRYTEAKLVAERFALLNSEDRAEILNVMKTQVFDHYEEDEDEQ